MLAGLHSDNHAWGGAKQDLPKTWGGGSDQITYLLHIKDTSTLMNGFAYACWVPSLGRLRACTHACSVHYTMYMYAGVFIIVTTCT